MPSNDQARLIALLDSPAMLIEGSRILFANPSAERLLGRHIAGEDVRVALRHPAAVALLTGEGEDRARIDGLSVAGSVWELAVHPLDDKRKLALLTDLSGKASLARAHSDFVANASHELRTPLAAVLGYVETLLDPRAGDDAETRNRFLGIVRHEAQRMQAMVEDLMALSRIEANKHDAPEEEVDLVARARLAVSEAGADRVALSSNADTALVHGDAGQLSQLLRNLIDNALKYGKEGGAVAVDLDVAKTGWVMVSIRDEGEGIAPEYLPRLTERFFRVDAGRSRAAGGTGLGLAIVKHIVERHRGRFDLSSRVGEGTTASFILPLRGQGEATVI
jgi:two-component system, OmpR family, phosphate regulon sensor histidine kinase PhoR